MFLNEAEPPAHERPYRRNIWRGALVGAALGAVLRPLVILLFYVGGAAGLRGHDNFAGLAELALPVALGIAAFDGLWIGAVTGAAARPAVGAIAGGLLSACLCGLYVRYNLAEFGVWIGLMGVVGAVAGGCGSAAGTAGGRQG